MKCTMDPANKFAKTFYFFLVLLICIQEAKSHTYPLDLHQAVTNRKSRSARSFEINKSNTEDGNELKVHSRQKRDIYTLLGGLTIAAMTAGLATEIVGYISKCCLLDSRVCGADVEMDNGKKRLQTLSADVNKLWTEVENQYTYTKYLNVKMDELWIHIKRIDETMTDMIKLIDPSVMQKLKEKQMELEERIKKSNKKYEDFEALKAEYDSVFKSVGTTIYTYYGFVTTPVFALTKSFVVNKIAAAGPGSFNNYKWYNPQKYLLKSAVTVKARWTKFSTKFPKSAKVFKHGAKSIFFGFSLAFQGWKIYQSVKRCTDFGDQVVKKLAALEACERNTTTLSKSVEKQMNTVKNEYNNLKAQLLTSDLTFYLENVKEFIKYSSDEFPEMETALSKINSFLNGIAVADLGKSDALVADLNIALQSVKGTMGCYREQLAVVKNLVETCKRGTKLNLKEIYHRATKTTKCQTIGYITERKSVGMARSSLNNMKDVSSECIYNGGDLKDSVCTLLGYGMDKNTVASMNKITIEQVNEFENYCDRRKG